jgi:4-hydroxybenzoate polyprenyltransferase
MNYLILIRPKQWIKNSFVLAPLIFSGQFKINLLYESIIAIFLFILASSCVYIFNDLNDLEYDKQHPTKKYRPITSGKVRKTEAYIFLKVLFISLIVLLFLLNISHTAKLFLSLYLIINIVYSLKLKEIPLLELALLSSGFVIRLLFGAEVLSISLSPWIIICSGLIALMISIGKRRNDLEQRIKDSRDLRTSLRGYNLNFLDQCNVLIASITITSYLLFCVSDYAIESIGKGLIWTSPFVIFSILRYLQLISVNQKGEDPTSMLIGDRVTVSLFLIWFIHILGLIYIG